MTPCRIALWLLATSTQAATVVDLGQPPSGLEWRTVTASALHKLLHTSYVASDDGSLALDYPEPTLKWMLGAPGARDELQLGLGEPGSQSLVACVCAAPCELLVRGEQHQALEVGLLCVHHSWRSRGHAPPVTEAAARPLVLAVPQSRSAPIARLATPERPHELGLGLGLGLGLEGGTLRARVASPLQAGCSLGPEGFASLAGNSGGTFSSVMAPRLSPLLSLGTNRPDAAAAAGASRARAVY